MSDQPANHDPVPDEELIAYLDGELDADTSRRIEDRLAADPAVREQLQVLQRTWDLLDELETSPVADDFACSTLEMVAAAAAAEVEEQPATAPRRRRWIAIAVGLMVTTAAGFLVVAMLLPDPNRQLVEDLPVLENLDEYRQVESIEFLRMLQEEGLFVEQSTPVDDPSGPGRTETPEGGV